MEPKSNFSLKELIGWLAFIIIGLNLIVAIPIVIEIFYTGFDSNFDFTLPINQLLAANIAWQILTLFTLYVLFIKKRINIKNYLNLGVNLNPKYLFLVLIIFIGMTFFSIPVSNYYEIPPNPLMDQLLTDGNPILITMTTVLLAPLMEEFLFRGFLFSELQQLYNSRVALHISAIIFTVIHIQYGVVEMAIILILAYTLGFLRLRFKNIAYPLLFHFLNNLGALMEFYMQQ